MFPVALVPEEENRTCDKDGRERSGQDTDHENKSEVIDDAGSENPQGHRSEESGYAGKN